MFRSQQNVSKRQRSPSLDRATDRLTVKKHCEADHPDHWIPSERFWDSLPQIYLTRRALAEHDRRIRQQKSRLHTNEETRPARRQSTRLRQLVRQKQLRSLRPTNTEASNLDLRRFSRSGGPDLTDIRGCPDPTMSIRTSRPSTRVTGSELTASSKRSGPYDANYKMKMAQAELFDQEETDENDDIITPASYDKIMERMTYPRRSLSPSRFTEQDFQKFRRLTNKEISEAETMQQSVAIIEGNAQILSRIGGPFNNLESFHPDIAMAVPDSYDGAPPLTIDHRVLNKLDRFIVPNTDTSRPAVPNFFLEGKSRRGRADVAKLQAAHTGAIGARAMMSLQNYPSEALEYDGNAYSFTNTYHDGQLKMYITHATAPKTPGGQPSYHMTQLRAFSMTDSSRTFREGATWYRNARDLAREQRNSFIQQANQAARQRPAGKRGESSRTTTNTASSVHSWSHERTYRSSPDTDTSADELALSDSSKRSRTRMSFNHEDRTPRHRITASRVRPASTTKTTKGRLKKTS